MKKNILVIFLVFSLFSNTNAQSWVQLGQQLIDGYRTSLSDSGNVVAVADFFFSSSSGKVSIYEETSGTWNQIGDDIIGNINSAFGSSISLNASGNTIAIAAPNEFINGIGSSTGSVTIYQNINGIWTQIGNKINGSTENGRLGRIVSMSDDGSIVAISGGIVNSVLGYVRIYRNINNTWTQIGDDINEIGDPHAFGNRIHLSGDGTTIAIGSPDLFASNTFAGYVEVYTNTNDNWTLVGSRINGVAPSDNFGGDVSINQDGSILAVGAPRNDTNGEDAGQVTMYENQGNNWTPIGSPINDSTTYDVFGGNIDLNANGDRIAIGATTRFPASNQDGKIIVYDRDGNNWIPVGQTLIGPIDSNFGGSIEISGDGTRFVTRFSFSNVLVYELNIPDTENPAANCQNITVELDATGFASISADQVDDNSTDNEGIANLEIDIDTFSCSNLGDNTITLTVTDTSGNIDSCTTVVTIVDNTLPTISCPEDIITINAPEPYLLEDFVMNTTIAIQDNCSNVQYTQTPIPGTSIDAGETTVIITAMDQSGNTSVCEFTVFYNPTLGIIPVNDFQSLKVYPNPTSEYILLQNIDNNTIDAVRLYDTTGRSVKKITIHQQETGYKINLQELNPAVYFLKIESGNKAKFLKIVKQ